MPRQPKPWFRKSRKSWFVTIGGVQHNLGTNKKEAQQLFHQLMRQPQRHKVSPESIAAIADAFLDWTFRNRAEATFEWYRERLQSFLQNHPDLTVAQIKPYHVERWSAAGKNRSVNTRRNLMRAVKRCFKWALTQGYLEHNPIAALEIPSATAKEVYVSLEEFKVLLANISNREFADLCSISYEVGCRPQESLRVEARHLDLDHCRWVFPKSESKGKHAPRIVYLTENAAAMSDKLAQLRPEGPIFRNSSGNPWTKDAVGCQFSRLQIRIGKQRFLQSGERIAEEDIEKFARSLRPTKTVKGKLVDKSERELLQEAKRKLLVRKACELAPRYSLYCLRHSWATNALKKVDPLTVAILMGHKDPSMLAKTYQHLSHNPEHLLNQARRAAG